MPERKAGEHEEHEFDYLARGDYKHFIFDPVNKTVLGRDAWSWFNVILFYIGYYSLIAVISYYTITGYQNQMLVFPGEKDAAPRTNTRVATPGLATFPGVENMIIDSNRVSSFEYIDKINERLMSVAENDDLKSKLTAMGDCSPICAEADQDCKYPPVRNSYQNGNPCIYYQINKVMGWQPYSYYSLDAENVQPRVDEAQSQVAQAVGENFEQGKVYFYCYDLDLERGFVNATDRVTMNYYSYDDESASAKSFGFFNNNNWPIAKGSEIKAKENPFIAVKFNVNPNYQGELINVACQAYAANLQANEAINEGIAVTSIKIEKQTESTIAKINGEFSD